MYRENLEPRKTVWAVAEVAWQDSTGIPHRLPATLEDTSVSGACIRVRTPITVGSSLTVKWQREQFSGVARNLRRDGGEFLLGIQKDATTCAAPASLPPVESLALPVIVTLVSGDPQNRETTASLTRATDDSGLAMALAEPSAQIAPKATPPSDDVALAPTRLTFFSEARAKPAPDPDLNPVLLPAPAISASATHLTTDGIRSVKPADEAVPKASTGPKRDASGAGIKRDAALGLLAMERSTDSGMQLAADYNSARSGPEPLGTQVLGAVPPLPERKNMSTKSVFSKLWTGRHENGNAPGTSLSSEVSMSKIDSESTSVAGATAIELLSCEDIYRASGILGSPSEYGIAKIVDMLSSKHIRDLAPDVKRASVLMALDAAGTAVDHVLQDAARRQHALDVYETGQQKLFDEFEARKTRENAAIQAELERLTAHYVERTQRNLDHIAREKEAFCKWQESKQQEYQRIAEAVSLCGKQPVTAPTVAKPAEPLCTAPPESPAAKPGETVAAQATSARAGK